MGVITQLQLRLIFVSMLSFLCLLLVHASDANVDVQKPLPQFFANTLLALPSLSPVPGFLQLPHWFTEARTVKSHFDRDLEKEERKERRGGKMPAWMDNPVVQQHPMFPYVSRHMRLYKMAPGLFALPMHPGFLDPVLWGGYVNPTALTPQQANEIMGQRTNLVRDIANAEAAKWALKS